MCNSIKLLHQSIFFKLLFGKSHRILTMNIQLPPFGKKNDDSESGAVKDGVCVSTFMDTLGRNLKLKGTRVVPAILVAMVLVYVWKPEITWIEGTMWFM
ncbi:hypothetical protein C5167_029236 [Papaver somniferum]|nr:hypothetical protein C5167_029236 [Papaver somniferum]